LDFLFPISDPQDETALSQPPLSAGLPSLPPLESPEKVRRQLDAFVAIRGQNERDLAQLQTELDEVRRYLGISEKVTQALESLSKQLFSDLLKLIQDKMTIALQEVLDQPIEFKAEVVWRNNAAAVDFCIERQGNSEDILKGQGGSVANVVSVGLRMFALTTLPESEHRRFLVLDEQDCWLRPDLVPRLVKIVHTAGKALGFQVLMISHHDPAVFEEYADRIYQVRSTAGGAAEVVLVKD
jgi:ABC-type glutathione transport system ATPase component